MAEFPFGTFFDLDQGSRNPYKELRYIVPQTHHRRNKKEIKRILAIFKVDAVVAQVVSFVPVIVLKAFGKYQKTRVKRLLFYMTFIVFYLSVTCSIYVVTHEYYSR
jgi:hypothetical protein